MHCVIDDQYPNHTNYHTHGLLEHFNHPDLQICLPIQTDLAQRIFEGIIENIKDGFCFQPLKGYSGLLKGSFKIIFVESVHDGRDILRVILPDENGSYFSPFYKEQLNQCKTLIDPGQLLKIVTMT